jgi:hypothetical protein
VSAAGGGLALLPQRPQQFSWLLPQRPDAAAVHLERNFKRSRSNEHKRLTSLLPTRLSRCLYKAQNGTGAVGATVHAMIRCWGSMWRGANHESKSGRLEGEINQNQTYGVFALKHERQMTLRSATLVATARNSKFGLIPCEKRP